MQREGGGPQRRLEDDKGSDKGKGRTHAQPRLCGNGSTFPVLCSPQCSELGNSISSYTWGDGKVQLAKTSVEVRVLFQDHMAPVLLFHSFAQHY